MSGKDSRMVRDTPSVSDKYDRGRGDELHDHDDREDKDDRGDRDDQRPDKRDGDYFTGDERPDPVDRATEKKGITAATVARVAGNLLSGSPGSWLGVTPEVRQSAIDTAVDTARLIAEAVQRLTVKGTR